MTTEPVAHRTSWWRLVPVAALLCFALSLRAPITVIPPLLTPVRSDLGIDAPTDVRVLRGEILNQVERENERARVSLASRAAEA